MVYYLSCFIIESQLNHSLDGRNMSYLLGLFLELNELVYVNTLCICAEAFC